MFSLFHSRRSRLVTRFQSPALRQKRLRMEQLEERTVLASWVGQIGGVGYDSVASRAIMDTAGNTYVGGVFSGVADFDMAVGTATLTSSGAEDAYIAKYAPDGGLLWARRFGGNENDSMASIRLDPASGSLYATGNFRGSADFTGDGVADQTSAGSTDVFIVKLDPATGSTLWHKRVGGTSSEVGNDVAAADGYVYVGGIFQSTTDFNPGAGTNTLTPAGKGNFRSPDGFLLKLTDQGNYVSAWQIGGSSFDSIRSLIVDGSTIYVAGDFNGSADLNPSAAVTTRTSNGRNDAFFGSYGTSGGLNWVQTIGGPGGDGSDWRLSSDNGSLYLTGLISEAADFDPGPGTATLTPAGGNDAMIAKYSKSSGAFQWAEGVGSAGEDDGRSEVVVNPLDGSIYWGGRFSGTVDFNPAAPDGELTSAGFHDGFLMKLDASGNYINAWRMGSVDYDGGTKPIGVFGGTLYAAGRFLGTADFPTGGTLTSYGDYDGFLMALDEAAPVPSPLLASSLPANSVEQSLTASDYQPLVAEALRRWEAAGVDTCVFGNVNIQVADLGGSTLGLASGNTIWLDDNAAGWGWFVDATPGDDSEFALSGNQGEQNRMDLLTVVMHELGHVLGHDHDDDGVMAETLAAGERRTDFGQDHVALTDKIFGQPEDDRFDLWLGVLMTEHLDSGQPWTKRRR